MSEIHIDRLAFGGAGVGRSCGKTCFVPYAAPGDIVIIDVLKSKKTYNEAKIKRLVQPSEHRLTPPCPFFGDCGGCGWQHISYEEQCRQKEQIVKDSLWRGTRLEQELVRTIIPATPSYNYRRRIQLKLHYANGSLAMGFYRPWSHTVVDVSDSCQLAHESINHVLPGIRTTVLDCYEPDKVPQIDLSCSENGDVAAVFHYSGSDAEGFATRVSASAKSFNKISSLAVQTGRRGDVRHVYGSQIMSYTLPGLSGDLCLKYAPGGFSQVNFQQNRLMALYISDLCAAIKPENLLDLYCGNGNFSLPLAGMVNRVVGFECFEKSVSFANSNAADNGILNAEYFCQDSCHALEMLARDKRKFDLAIIDPPRSGAADVAARLCKTGASSVIYVSCDPMTLARDISLLQATGYKVVQVQPFDMFPQTHHIENIVYLKADR